MDSRDFAEIKNKLNNILTKNKLYCQHLFDEYKKSHNSLVLIYNACKVLLKFNQNFNIVDIGKQLSHFDIMDNQELTKLVDQQNKLMKKIKMIEKQIKPTPQL